MFCYNLLCVLKALEDASHLIQSIEDVEKARGGGRASSGSQHFKGLQRKWFAARMEAKSKLRTATMASATTQEEQARCRQHLLEMRSVLAHQAAASVAADKLDASSSSSSAAGVEVLELSLAALVNLEDWDFVLGLAESKFAPLSLAQRTLQLAVALRGGAITLDIKKTCQAVADTLRPVVQQPLVNQGLFLLSHV